MRMGFISDIHEDMIRLDQAFAVLNAAKVDKIICLGDMVGYSIPFYGHLKTRDANAVVSKVREQCVASVVGNHDLFAIRKIPKHRSFFNYSDIWYQLDFRVRQTLGDETIFLYEDHELPALLSEANGNYINQLPEITVLDCGDRRILVSHYAFPDPTGSSRAVITSSAQLTAHFELMQNLGCDLAFSGNDHYEGAVIGGVSGMSQVGFGSVTLPDGPIWVDGPAVTRGTTPNGLMIYDGTDHSLQIIPLESPIYRLPDDY
jgi:predicted phosphodiesterase